MNPSRAPLYIVIFLLTCVVAFWAYSAGHQQGVVEARSRAGDTGAGPTSKVLVILYGGDRPISYWVVPSDDEASNRSLHSPVWEITEKPGAEPIRVTGTVVRRTIPYAMSDRDLRDKYSIPPSAQRLSDYPGL